MPIGIDVQVAAADALPKRNLELINDMCHVLGCAVTQAPCLLIDFTFALNVCMRSKTGKQIASH